MVSTHFSFHCELNRQVNRAASLFYPNTGISSLNPLTIPFSPNLGISLNPNAATFCPRHSSSIFDTLNLQKGLESPLGMDISESSHAPVNHNVLKRDTPVFSLNPKAQEFIPNGLINSKVESISFESQGLIIEEIGENDDSTTDIYLVLDEHRKNNIHKIIFGLININSIRFKIDMLADIIKDRIDILCVVETKVDESFSPQNFYIDGFSPPFRRDRNVHGGGLLLYVRRDIPAKEIILQDGHNGLELILIEINVHKKKWLVGNFYNPDKSHITKNLSHLRKIMDHYLPFYDNVVILGDFNAETSDNALADFCAEYD